MALFKDMYIHLNVNNSTCTELLRTADELKYQIK